MKKKYQEKMGMLKSFSIVFNSNILSLLKGVLISICIPKILSISAYGDYKLFTLYLSYIGLFHFGLIDGVCVKFAGRTLEETGIEKFRLYTRLLYIIVVVETAILLGVGLFLFEGSSRILICFYALDITIHNINSYFQSVMQISMQFKKYARVNVINSLFQLLGVLILYLISFVGLANSTTYIIIYIMGELGILIVCAREIPLLIYGKSEKIFETRQEIQDVFKKGIPLLIAGIVATLVYNLDRQFVASLFSKVDYATYAFAYSIMNLIIVLVSAMSIVIYPSLKKKEKASMVKYYNYISTMVAVCVFAGFCFVQILVTFINWYLPAYADSINIFLCILPSTVTICVLQIVLINYYKALEITNKYFVLSIFALIISFALNCIGYYLYQSMSAIAVATVISCFIWYVIGNIILQKVLEIKNYLGIYIGIMTIIYYLSFMGYWKENRFITTLIYSGLFLVVTGIFYGRKIKNMISNNGI